jgi:hypothetical protein
MLTALILVCSLTSVPDLGACNEHNAVQVVRDPEQFASPVTCFMHGQAYLAQTAIGQDLAEKEVVKVICAPSRAAGEPRPEAAANAALAR